MQNKALENTIYVLGAGAFGVFLRWLQLQLAFDENGLCGPSAFNVIVPLYLIVAAWALRRRIGQLLDGGLTLPKDFSEALGNPGRFYAFLRWALGALMALGGVLMIRGSEVEKQVFLLRLLGGLAILAGGCVPLYLGWANRELKPRRRGLLCLLALAPILLFAVWLVYDYVANAINSVVWAFLIEVLTVSTLMLAFFRLAGFAYEQVSLKRTLFWLQFGTVTSIVSLADGRSTGMQAVFLAAGLLLALADFILLRKLREKQKEEQKAEQPPEPEKIPHPASIGFDRL